MKCAKKNKNSKRFTHFLTSLFILIATTIFCFPVKGQSEKVEAEEYAIYSAILKAANNSTILNRKREFPSTEKGGRIFVIQNRTSGLIDDWYIKGTDKCEAKPQWRRLKPILTSLIINNRRTYHLQKRFHLTSKYSLLDENSFTAFFNENPGMVGFEVFRKKYGQRSAYYIFSRAGFNRQKTKALVYVFEYCSAICAFARFIQLNKVGTQWKVAAEFGC